FITYPGTHCDDAKVTSSLILAITVSGCDNVVQDFDSCAAPETAKISDDINRSTRRFGPNGRCCDHATMGVNWSRESDTYTPGYLRSQDLDSYSLNGLE